MMLKYYFSGTHGRTSGPEHEELVQLPLERLFSCHGNYISFARKCLADMVRLGSSSKQEIMLDSGAFTAWTKGIQVKRDDLVKIYDSFLEDFGQDFKQFWLINLDRIPGKFGRDPTSQEVEDAMLESNNNFDFLKTRYGDKVIPVYHQNEPAKQLLHLATIADYICLSPRNDLPEPSRIDWSRQAHRLLLNKKTHGLATTGVSMMRGSPWYSVDSASWNLTAGMGGIMLYLNNDLYTIAISNRSPKLQDFNAHYDTLPQRMREQITERLTLHKVTLAQLQTDHMPRRVISMKEIQTWLESFTYTPSSLQQKLFAL